MPPDALDAERIRAALPGAVSSALQTLEVVASVDSTNAALLREPPPAAGRYRACLAERQSAGVGRRGARWQSPAGAGIYLSVATRLARGAPLSALGLACGVAALDALTAVGVTGVQLKWPNDLIHADAKLGGVLVQSRSSSGGDTHAVAGIGINVHLAPQGLGDDALPATSLAALSERAPPPRNALAAALLDALIESMGRFAEEGFAPFRARWLAADGLRDRRVRVVDGQGAAEGIARGVAADGALELDTGEGLARVVSGSVRLRGQGAS